MAEYQGTATVIPPPLTPALSPSVHLSLTIMYTTLYGMLFFIVYVQLWMILYYRHRRFSYESVFLFLCLFWAALRTTLFSFYFKNCVLVNNLNTFSYWLFYCCPICLQFVTLCLLVVFFAQVCYTVYRLFRPICVVYYYWYTQCVTSYLRLKSLARMCSSDIRLFARINCPLYRTINSQHLHNTIILQ